MKDKKHRASSYTSEEFWSVPYLVPAALTHVKDVRNQNHTTVCILHIFIKLGCTQSPYWHISFFFEIVHCRRWGEKFGWKEKFWLNGSVAFYLNFESWQNFLSIAVWRVILCSRSLFVFKIMANKILNPHPAVSRWGRFQLKAQWHTKVRFGTSRFFW